VPLCSVDEIKNLENPNECWYYDPAKKGLLEGVRMSDVHYGRCGNGIIQGRCWWPTASLNNPACSTNSNDTAVEHPMSAELWRMFPEPLFLGVFPLIIGVSLTTVPESIDENQSDRAVQSDAISAEVEPILAAAVDIDIDEEPSGYVANADGNRERPSNAATIPKNALTVVISSSDDEFEVIKPPSKRVAASQPIERIAAVFHGKGIIFAKTHPCISDTSPTGKSIFSGLMCQNRRLLKC
jgi:hypothetical protein